MVSNIGKKILSIFNLKKDPKVKVNFEGSNCTVFKGQRIAKTGTKCKENLFITAETSGYGLMIRASKNLKTVKNIKNDEQSSSSDEVDDKYYDY